MSKQVAFVVLQISWLCFSSATHKTPVILIHMETLLLQQGPTLQQLLQLVLRLGKSNFGDIYHCKYITLMLLRFRKKSRLWFM